MTNDSIELYKQSVLAMAAYANLQPGIPNEALLREIKMADLQASRFATDWRVVDRYTDGTGVSATVFEEVATGRRYLAIRGTEPADVLDLAADYLLSNGFPPQMNLQFASLRERIEAWSANGVLPANFTVTGHSLGGYLADAVALQFGNRVSAVYTYNAPGMDGVFSPLVDVLRSALGVTGLGTLANLTNLRGTAGASVIAGLGTQLAPPVFIETEASVNPIDHHSIVGITDALAVYDLFARTDSSLGVESIGAILKAATDQNAATLEAATQALGKVFLAVAPDIPVGDRDALYRAYGQIREAIDTLQALGETYTVRRMGLDAAADAALAKTDIACRFALKELLPFAVQGRSYDAHAAALSLYDPATGAGELTGDWLFDRAAMLGWKLKLATEDAQADTTAYGKGGAPDAVFKDLASGLTMNLGSNWISPAAKRRIVFDGDTGTTVEGGSTNDRLYGAGGDDTLYGYDGGDYLEGGTGIDTLEGGAGNDILLGGAGNDRLQGGAGADTYRWRKGDGLDSVEDADGAGRIQLVDGSGARYGLHRGRLVSETETFKYWTDVEHGAVSYRLDKNSKKLEIRFQDAAGGLDIADWDAGELSLDLGYGGPLSGAEDEPASPIQSIGAAANVYGDFQRAETAPYGPDNETLLYDSAGNAKILFNRPQPRDDTLTGTAGTENMFGGAYGDSLDGRDGDDYLVGGADSDTLYGGAGNDELYGENDADTDVELEDVAALSARSRSAHGLDTDAQYSGYQNPVGVKGDWVAGGSGDDLIYGSAGNDGLAGGAGSDEIHGGAGADVVWGDADIVAQSNRWVVNLDGSLDLVTGALPRLDEVPNHYGDYPYWVGSADAIYAGSGNDTVDAGGGDDFVDAGAGDDLIAGGTGNDLILGGAGNDRLFGGAGLGAGFPMFSRGLDAHLGPGPDFVPQIAGHAPGQPFDARDDDVLSGGDGNDVLHSDAGNDLLSGDQGDDTYVVAAISGVVQIEDADGINTLVLPADMTPGSLRLRVLNTADGEYLGINTVEENGVIVRGIVIREGLRGRGVQRFRFAGGEEVSLAGLLEQNDFPRFVGTARPEGSELLGGRADDSLYGGVGADTLRGQSGNDRLDGGAGDDILEGGAGQDQLWGGTGNDLLLGGSGADTLQGNAGDDTYVFNAGDGEDVVTDGEGINRIRFGAGIAPAALTLSREGAQDIRLQYGAGDAVRIEGGFVGGIASYEFADGTVLSREQLLAQLDNTPLNLQGDIAPNRLVGGNANDTLEGREGSDHLFGGAGNDVLSGGDGWDRLDGGRGEDRLDGGAEADTYAFNLGDGHDVIAETDSGGTTAIANTIAFGPGIALDTVVSHRQVDAEGGEYLVIDYGNQGDRIEIRDGLRSDAWSFSFADDGELTGAQFLERTLAEPLNLVGTAADDVRSGSRFDDTLNGGAGNDRLQGGAGNDRLIGGTGTDTLEGGAGSDTYIIERGMGRDTVIEAGTDNDRIELAAGLSIADLVASREANDLFLGVAGSEDGLLLKGYFASPKQWQFGPAGETTALSSVLDQVALAQQTRPLSERVQHYQDAFLNGLTTQMVSNVFTYGTVTGAGGTYSRSRGSGTTQYRDTLTIAPVATASDATEIAGTARDTTVSWREDLGARTAGRVETVQEPIGRYVPHDEALAYLASLNGTQLAPGTRMPTQAELEDPNGFFHVTGYRPRQVTRTYAEQAYAYHTDRTLEVDVITAGASANHIRLDRRPALVDAGAGDDWVQTGSVETPDFAALAQDSPFYWSWSPDIDNPDRLHDFLYGNAGNDTLLGSGEHDELIGGEGNDRLNGRGGADVYRVVAGAGQGLDLIFDSGYTDPNDVYYLYYGGRLPTDTVLFEAGVRPEDLHFTWTREEEAGERFALEIQWGTEGGVRVVMPNADDALGIGIERFEFADGTVLTRQQLLDMAPPRPSAINTAPTLDQPVSDQTAAEDSLFDFTVPTKAFVDADPGDTLTYTATRADGSALPAWLNFDAATRTFSGTPTNADVGTLSVQVTATDGGGLTVSDVFDLTVANVNDAPVANASVPAQNATENAAFAYTLPANAFIDVDAGDSFTLSATLADGTALPAWLGFDAATATFSGTPPVGEIGTLSIKVIARDTSNATGALGFDLTVAAAPGQTLSGTSGANTLTGLSGDDTLDGGAGADTLIGRKGNDTYVVDNAADAVIEQANEGTDTVQASVSYTTSDHVENLLLSGSANLNGYGNALDNTLTGNAGANTLAGDAGNDTLYGLGGNDKLYGDAGEDRVFGGTGNDSLYGWTGNDWLEGEDGADKLYGDDGDDVALGGAGDDTLYGWSGNDYLAGEAGIDRLEGEEGNDLMQGGAGADTLWDIYGANPFDGGADNDKLTGGANAEFFLGGTGNDTLTTGEGADVIVFNKGDGQDTVIASQGLDNTLAIGGGIGYGELSLSKSGNHLVLNLGGSDRITLKDWYTVGTNGERYKSVLNLQLVAEAMAEFDANSADALRNKKIAQFDFAGLADAFDQARTADPTLTSWALTNALTQFHLGGSDTAALGGDLAYQYGRNGTLAGIGVTAAQEVIGAPQFGASAQTLRPLASLQGGSPALG